MPAAQKGAHLAKGVPFLLKGFCTGGERGAGADEPVREEEKMIEQILAITIFLIMFGVIISEKIERHWVSLGCGLIMLIVVFGICMRSPEAIWNTINIKEFASKAFWIAREEGSEAAGVNWATISFIFGMMIMVEGMGKAGFFRWLCLRIAKSVKYKTMPIFITFMVMSFVLAMFIDSITVILFLAAVTVELAEVLGFSPISMILAEVFCANLGGSATMCGDPPNIIIGTSLGYSFGDFVKNTGVIALIALAFTLTYYYLYFRRQFKGSSTVSGAVSYPEPSSAISSKRDFVISCLIFACAVALLVTHSMTGLTVATIGLFVAALTLLSSPRSALEMLRKVDYKTLLFFVGLFVVVGGLEQTGVLKAMAGMISSICGDNAYVMVAVILWMSAIASAFVDNIPFSATMIPVIKTLAETTGMDLAVLSWTLACGTDIGGSATPIGASANVVGVSIASQNGHIIGWGKYCKVMVPITVLTILISMICIYLRYL